MNHILSYVINDTPSTNSASTAPNHTIEEKHNVINLSVDAKPSIAAPVDESNSQVNAPIEKLKIISSETERLELKVERILKTLPECIIFLIDENEEILNPWNESFATRKVALIDFIHKFVHRKKNSILKHQFAIATFDKKNRVNLILDFTSYEESILNTLESWKTKNDSYTNDTIKDYNVATNTDNETVESNVVVKGKYIIVIMH